MKTLHLAIITIVAIASLVIVGTYIIFNPIIRPPSTDIVGFVRSNQSQSQNKTNQTIKDSSLTNIGNQTFYFTTLNDTLSSYHGIAAIPFTFHNINFTLFPSIFVGGPPGSCGVTPFSSEVKFSDGTYEKLSVQIPGQPCAENYTETVLSNHQNPQAGITVYHDQIKLLVSADSQTSTQVSETMYHDYPDSPQYSIVDTTVGIPVENDSLATKMVGFNVTSPTYLPQGYQVRLIKIAKNIPWVTIFASKYPLTNETTNEEFFYNDTGILITYSKLSDRALKDHQWMWPMATTIKKVAIDGFDAGIEGIRKGQYNGYSYDQWADLVLFKDKILIGVRGFFSDDDLVKITKSMLENQK